jgi:hypothetical protein
MLHVRCEKRHLYTKTSFKSRFSCCATSTSFDTATSTFPVAAKCNSRIIDCNNADPVVFEITTPRAGSGRRESAGFAPTNYYDGSGGFAFSFAFTVKSCQKDAKKTNRIGGKKGGSKQVRLKHCKENGRRAGCIETKSQYFSYKYFILMSLLMAFLIFRRNFLQGTFEECGQKFGNVSQCDCG